jgi:acyl dehydratase
MDDLYFEDFTPGREFRTEGVTVTESQILDFALAFDPQPFHLDAEAAKGTIFGGLIASGFHTMALTFRLFAQTRALVACSLGSPGVDELRWLRPVRPGTRCGPPCRSWSSARPPRSPTGASCACTGRR